MSVESGDGKQLKAHKAKSQATTRFELEKALRRLVNGNPCVVAKGTKVTPSSVAREAGVDRSTLYRYHEPVLGAIRRLNDTASQASMNARQSELLRLRSRAKEYRQLIETTQAELTRIAQHNYALNERNRELETLLRQRDELIRDLHRQVNGASKGGVLR